MLKIRLARIGKKKKPTYRFVVSESGRDLYGPALEILGHFNPSTKVIDVDKDRLLYWMSKGAQPSPTVHNMLVDQNVISAPKVRASKAGKKSAEETTASTNAAPASAESPATETTAPTPPPAEEKPAEPSAETPAETPAEPTK